MVRALLVEVSYMYWSSVVCQTYKGWKVIDFAHGLKWKNEIIGRGRMGYIKTVDKSTLLLITCSLSSIIHKQRANSILLDQVLHHASRGQASKVLDDHSPRERHPVPRLHWGPHLVPRSREAVPCRSRRNRSRECGEITMRALVRPSGR